MHCYRFHGINIANQKALNTVGVPTLITILPHVLGFVVDALRRKWGPQSQTNDLLSRVSWSSFASCTHRPVESCKLSSYVFPTLNFFGGGARHVPSYTILRAQFEHGPRRQGTIKWPQIMNQSDVTLRSRRFRWEERCAFVPLLNINIQYVCVRLIYFKRSPALMEAGWFSEVGVYGTCRECLAIRRKNWTNRAVW